MLIMVSGPYGSGGADAATRAARLRALNEAACVSRTDPRPPPAASDGRAALALHRMGHVRVIGVNMALPVFRAAGGGEAAYGAIVLPLALALAERRDACLRIGGPSSGADAAVARFRALGRPVWRRLEDVPAATVAR